MNLIPISNLSRLTVTFSSTSCVVLDPCTGRTVDTGPRQETLNYLDYLHVPPTTAYAIQKYQNLQNWQKESYEFLSQGYLLDINN